MTAAEEFVGTISKWTDAYTRLAFSYAGVKASAGIEIICGRVHLKTAHSDEENAPFKFETDHIIVERNVGIIESLPIFNLVENIVKTGRVDLFGKSISLPADLNSRNISSSMDLVTFPFYSRLTLRGISHYTTLRAQDTQRVIERELQSADTPYDTLDELLDCGGLPSFRQMGDNAMLDIVANSPGSVDRESRITDGVASIECHLACGLHTSKSKIGWRLVQKDQRIARGSLLGSRIQWKANSAGFKGTFKVSTEEAATMEIYLSYDSIVIDKCSFDDPSQRLNVGYTIHKAFDPNCELLLESLLRPENDKGNIFEFAVSTFLSLSGFSITHHGRFPKLQDGPDIIAITRLGRIAVVECTVGLIDSKGKLSKLVQRHQQIEKELSATGRKFIHSQPMIFTPLTREENERDIESAAKHGIAVVCKQDLEGFVNRLALPPDGDALFDELRKLIPKTEKLLSLGFE